MSGICITHLAVLCNYAPCSNTCRNVLHVNSIWVIREPYEYTVNWQQISLFNFQSFCNYQRNHNGLFLLLSHSLPPWNNCSLGSSSQTVKEAEGRMEKIKRGKVINGKLAASRLLVFLYTCLNLREIAGDSASTGDQRGSWLCFAYLKHYQ